jgi:hypothetical protein
MGTSGLEGVEKIDGGHQLPIDLQSPYKFKLSLTKEENTSYKVRHKKRQIRPN